MGMPPMPSLDAEESRERFDRAALRDRLAQAARQGVFLGTSSWKYLGWLGQVYDEQRYIYRGRFSKTRFERQCLREYAETFPTVCVDAAYYRFPDTSFLEDLVSQAPSDFRFALKVTDEITVKRFPNLARFGPKAGKPNPRFLDAELFFKAFAEPCRPFLERIGLLVFEFSRFYPADFARGREFVDALDKFFESLPSGWPYGVEIRNPSFLRPEYFEVLARNGVTHVYNNWEAMPDISAQLDMDGSLTAPERVGARFLLKRGRRYQSAVDKFSPYDRVRDANPRGRQAGARLIRETRRGAPGRKTFIYVNNRFEGNAPRTIAAMLEQAGIS